jgi:hypothetical protein
MTARPSTAKALLTLFLLMIACAAIAQVARTPDITGDELIMHIKKLTSDEFEGRETGTAPAMKAAEYIASEFALYGLKPAGDSGSYFQRFDVVMNVAMGAKNRMELQFGKKKTALKLKNDFQPLGLSSSGMYSGPIVFAGFGAVTKDSSYNDYRGVNIKDKAVMLLTGSPTLDSTHVVEMIRQRSLSSKVGRALGMGAKVVIVVLIPEEGAQDTLYRFYYDRTPGNAGLPVVTVTQSVADRMLAGAKKKIKNLKDEIERTKKDNSFEVKGVKISCETELHEIIGKGVNVVGILEGNDASLRNDALVIGAHYDHLGWGGPNSGSLEPQIHAIHPGADDNASGTAGVMEIAQAFAANGKNLRRTIVFIAFAGEEMGTLGSAYYTKFPSMPLQNTITMVNMDMIGRLMNRQLTVFGTGTAKNFETILNSHNTDSTFTLQFNPDGYGPSDFSSFYAKKIPVLNFFTGTHGDYHRPVDTWDKIEKAGTEKVVRYVYVVSAEIESTLTAPQYVSVDRPQNTPTGRTGMRVRLGIIPGFGEKNGVGVTGVRGNSPAEKAGMKGGDVIVKIGNVDIKNMNTYMDALSAFKPGDSVDIVITRGSETITVKAVLEKSQ